MNESVAKVYKHKIVNLIKVSQSPINGNGRVFFASIICIVNIKSCWCLCGDKEK